MRKLNTHNVDLLISAVSKKQYPEHKKPEVAMCGRSNVGKSSFINTILERKNELLRPKVANIDYSVIIVSVKDPDFSSKLLNKIICLNENSNVEIIIIFTKLDLLLSEEFENIQRIMNYYKEIGYNVFSNNDEDIDEFKNIVSQKYVSISGQSGAGKSTFINKISSNLDIETGEISKHLGRGRHTTRHTEFYRIDDFYIADTPGFSSLDLTFIEKEDIQYLFLMNDDENPLSELLLKLVRFFKSYTVDVINMDTLIIADTKPENAMKYFDEIHYMKKLIQVPEKLHTSFDDVVNLMVVRFLASENKNDNVLKFKDKFISEVLIRLTHRNLNSIRLKEKFDLRGKDIEIDSNVSLYDIARTNSTLKVKDKNPLQLSDKVVRMWYE